MPEYQPPPLEGLRVLEFAGLAPGPFAGLLLADYGATVLRIDRATPPSPTTTPSDQLTRRKTSIRVNIKQPSGIALLKHLALSADVLIDPFRPGVLEKAGLSPQTLLQLNPRLIVARLTGFRRDGKYKDMAGHDINYIAVAGVLALFGRQGERPYAPGNVVGDFAGGGAMCVVGILMALLARARDGRGQVVEANMVDGSAVLASMPRLGMRREVWGGERGTNLLDGGAPFYDTYETKDGGYMAVGAIEPPFFAALLHGLSIPPSSLPGPQTSKPHWPLMRTLFAKTFASKTRAEWEAIFDGTDACCTPVLTQRDLEARGFDHRPAVTLGRTPGLAVKEGEAGREAAVGQGTGWRGSGWEEEGLRAGEGGEETIQRWMGWRRGRHYDEVDGGLVWLDTSRL